VRNPLRSASSLYLPRVLPRSGSSPARLESIRKSVRLARRFAPVLQQTRECIHPFESSPDSRSTLFMLPERASRHVGVARHANGN